MKKNHLLAAFLCALFSTTLCADEEDEPKTQATIHSVATLNGEAVIFLDKNAQKASGLKTLRVISVKHQAEVVSYGTAISAEPLLAIHNHYLNALAQQRSAQAQAGFSQQNAHRQSYLQHEGIVSVRALQDQQTRFQTDKAAWEGSSYLVQQIISNAQLLWGSVLTDVLMRSAPFFKDLMAQRAVLLKVTFPTNQPMTSALKTIFIAPTTQRDQAVAARFISPAPQADSFSPGQPYFYQVSSPQIKAGMRVNAWLPTQQQQTGVIIPESALVWHLGVGLVFVKVTEQQFVAHALGAYHKTTGGYFVNAGLKEGTEIVSVGAQMLLSQQFKAQIPSEDDD